MKRNYFLTGLFIIIFALFGHGAYAQDAGDGDGGDTGSGTAPGDSDASDVDNAVDAIATIANSPALANFASAISDLADTGLITSDVVSLMQSNPSLAISSIVSQVNSIISSNPTGNVAVAIGNLATAGLAVISTGQMAVISNDANLAVMTSIMNSTMTAITNQGNLSDPTTASVVAAIGNISGNGGPTNTVATIVNSPSITSSTASNFTTIGNQAQAMINKQKAQAKPCPNCQYY